VPQPEVEVEVRQATAGDAGAVAGLAAELALSFPFSPERFSASYPGLLADDRATYFRKVLAGRPAERARVLARRRGR
jgi:hypothetical protein